MALNETRLKNKIIAIQKACREYEGNGDGSSDYFATQLAKAIIEEIQELDINYIAGLISPRGAVTGDINATIS